MSSIRDPQKFRRASPRGLVYQGERIVGGVHLPADMQTFVDDFNREYAAAGLRMIPANDPTISSTGSPLD